MWLGETGWSMREDEMRDEASNGATIKASGKGTIK
jgi:hypothetical protein